MSLVRHNVAMPDGSAPGDNVGCFACMTRDHRRYKLWKIALHLNKNYMILVINRLVYGRLRRLLGFDGGVSRYDQFEDFLTHG